MEERLIEFIAGLRAAGVRISVAESADAFRAIEAVGVEERETFQAALRTTLVKEPVDVPTFERLFPQYFSINTPPMLPANDGLTPDEQRQLMDSMESLSQQLADLLKRLLEGQQLNPNEMNQLRQRMEQMQNGQNGQNGHQQQSMPGQRQSDGAAQAFMRRLAQLLSWLMTGQPPSDEELEQLGKQTGLQQANHPFQKQAVSRRMQRAVGLDQLEELIEEVMRQLAQAGLTPQATEKIGENMMANGDALKEQIDNFVGASIERQVAEQTPPPARVDDLMQRPFQSLSEQEANQLRSEVRRLAAQLRSRASLRHRRGKTGILDPKATIRTNLRYGGVPVELRHRKRQVKPKLVLICDISTSMRSVVEFLLTLVYELQDQVARARSFAFIDDIQEITQDFTESRPAVAIQGVLERMPPGYYNTDLGFSLEHLLREYMDAVDHRTTVIVVGDGRNNFNPPNLEAIDRIRGRAKRLLWFNPENPALWGSGDSDMDKYLPYCDAVHEVGTLAQLAQAVDSLFTGH